MQLFDARCGAWTVESIFNISLDAAHQEKSLPASEFTYSKDMIVTTSTRYRTRRIDYCTISG